MGPPKFCGVVAVADSPGYPHLYIITANSIDLCLLVLAQLLNFNENGI